MKVSIIIPAYNESETILTLLKKISRIPTSKNQKEIIIVNDGSTDDTLEKIVEFSRNKKNIIIINKKKNAGKGFAIKVGLEKASGDILLIQDADLEYDASNIPYLIKKMISAHTQILYGSRRLNKKNEYSSLPYFLGGVLINTIIALIVRRNLTDSISGTKLFTRNVYNKIKPITSKGFEIDVEITAKAIKKGFDVQEVPITYFPRTHNQGKKIRWFHSFRIILTLIRYSF